MILLLAVQSAPPLPIGHAVGPVPDVLPRHFSYFAFIERITDRSPVHECWLHFHYPEIFTLPSAGKIVDEAISIWIQVPLANIVVPGSEIEIFCYGVMVKSVGPS